MYIIPAIDLRDGKCVRLIQGNYRRQLNYKLDPVEQAKQFISDGAQWLHVIDLDGAKIGKPVNTPTISAIATLRKLKIEVGGGLREEASIKLLLDIGVERVIIGTKAVTDFQWFTKIAEKFEGRIVLGLDARGSDVATHGWTRQWARSRPTSARRRVETGQGRTKGSPQKLLDFAAKAAKLPLAAIIYTDIDKDGMLAGPNLERTKALVETVQIPIIASGGICKIDNIKKLAKLGVQAAIIGRALYEGTLNLSDAINAANLLSSA